MAAPPPAAGPGPARAGAPARDRRQPCRCPQARRGDRSPAPRGLATGRALRLGLPHRGRETWRAFRPLREARGLRRQLPDQLRLRSVRQDPRVQGLRGAHRAGDGLVAEARGSERMTMPLDEMRQDLEAEQAALDALVAGLTAAQWAAPTPSEGWAVRDQIAHLAHFDDVAALAITAPEGFAPEGAAAGQDIPGYAARYLAR